MTAQATVAPMPASPPLSPEVGAKLLYDANRKTLLAAYLLWLFLGVLEGHNFYLRRRRVAIAQLVLSLTIVGLLVTLPWTFWEAFLIPGWVRALNTELAQRLGATWAN
jgi:hypothetical protein